MSIEILHPAPAKPPLLCRWLGHSIHTVWSHELKYITISHCERCGYAYALKTPPAPPLPRSPAR